MMQADEERTLRIGEKRKVGFTFGPADRPDSVTVLSGTASASPTGVVTLEAPTVNLTGDADGGYVWVTGAAAGECDITLVYTFSDGQKPVKIYRIHVETAGLSDDCILTISEAKAHLQSSPAVGDASIVQTAIEAISARFARAIGVRSLRYKAYTAETLDGPGKRYLYLPAWPVVSITSLTEDGVALVEDTDYYGDYAVGILERATGKWLRKRKAIVTTFAAGYTISGAVTLPWDLKVAALNEVARMALAVKNSRFGETSRSLENESFSFKLDEFLPDTIETLRHYRRLGI